MVTAVSVINVGQVDSTEFAELAESAENHNFLPSLIKQPKYYPWTYSDTFSQILSMKNNSNSIFLRFRVFVCGPMPKNEKAELAEGFKKFLKFTESVLDSGCSAQINHLLPMFIYTADCFSNFIHLNFLSNKKLENGTSFAQVKADISLCSK